MDLNQLQDLMDAGTEHTFRATFAGRSEGARGTVVQVGFPAAPNKVVVQDIAGGRHVWDVRHLRIL
jgi:hypothetical protein